MQNRRRFIKKGLLAVAGTGLLSRYYHPEEFFPSDSESKTIDRTLGRTGIKVPVISMGTNNTSNPGLIITALDRGIKLLATAGAYQNGNNERMIGEAIKSMPRESYCILTNSFDINWLETSTGIMNSSFTYDKLRRATEESLSRLGISYVDILTQPFAAGRESVFYEPVLRAMENLKKEGFTRFIGIATHRNEPEAVRAAADTGIHDIVMTSYNFLKTNREELDDAIRYAAESGVGIIAMKTMAGVYWDKERTKPVNTRAALKWVLQNPNIHTSVPDIGNLTQLEQDLGIMSDPRLTDDEMKDLISPSGGNTSGLFCQQCGECISQCPCDIDIPAIMRSYMYAFGHNDLAHAKMAIAETGLNTVPCYNCTACSVKCKMGFNIREKITNIFSVTGFES